MREAKSLLLRGEGGSRSETDKVVRKKRQFLQINEMPYGMNCPADMN